MNWEAFLIGYVVATIVGFAGEAVSIVQMSRRP
jgi:Ca2+/H+ antiporter